jgi:DNA-binding NtrC family response regulator
VPLRQRLRFERYLSEVASRFLDLAPEKVEVELLRAHEELLEALDIERSEIALFNEAIERLVVFSSVARDGVDPMPFVDISDVMPWYREQLREGKRIIFARLPADLPPEAEGERAHVQETGMRSHAGVLMKAAGEIQGGLSVSTFRRSRDWGPELVPRLELLAGVFAAALYRRTAHARVRAAEELNRSILASLPQEVLVLDPEERILAANGAWTRGVARGTFPAAAPGDAFGDVLEWEARLGGNDGVVDGVRAVLSGESPRFEGRCRHPGRVGRRDYSVTVTPLQGEQSGAVVVHTDVTELEEARAALERSLREVSELREKVEAENLVLRQHIGQRPGADEIVGTSPLLGRVLAQVDQVAPTDVPVLLLGETGTGKDLIARALHGRSPRHERPLVTVNCAALPPTLVESELFGHEKGAFTGALQRHVGRFEVADGGTLFLDEIGELPPEVQVKLLRVVQSGEFERLGSTTTIRVDVRLIAATNRDLERDVREGRFRADLFYRLGVFPIMLAPLRERGEDIPLLVWHFIGLRQAGVGRSIREVPQRLMRAFTEYPWPGNVRELQNVVERALIMSSGSTLAADPGFLKATPARAPARPNAATLADAEREHIRSILDQCGWRISGRGNAADRLGLKRSTLQSRMKKLGLERHTGQAPTPGPRDRRRPASSPS